MKILKGILYVVLGLAALVLIGGLFMAKDYTITREVVINKPKQVVFDYVKMLKNQDNFSYWAMKEPTMQKTYAGTDGTVGFKAAWVGKEMGEGEQTITGITEGQKMEFSLHFIKPMEGMCSAYMTTDAVGESQTKVTWAFNGHSKYPMNFMNFVMTKVLGNQLQTGLDNLKGLMEK